jgi:hypothetical protein
VKQDFDASKFNFQKAFQKEVLFQFEPSLGKSTVYTEEAVARGSPNLVFINVSPIEYGHVLLVGTHPRFSKRASALPTLLDRGLGPPAWCRLHIAAAMSPWQSLRCCVGRSCTILMQSTDRAVECMPCAAASPSAGLASLE